MYFSDYSPTKNNQHADQTATTMFSPFVRVHIQQLTFDGVIKKKVSVKASIALTYAYEIMLVTDLKILMENAKHNMFIKNLIDYWDTNL